MSFASRASETAQVAAHVVVITDQLHFERVTLADKNGAELPADARFENPWPQLADAKAGMHMRPAECDRDGAHRGEGSGLFRLRQLYDRVLGAGPYVEPQLAPRVRRR